MWKWIVLYLIISAVASAFHKSSNPIVSGISDLVILIGLLVLIFVWRRRKNINKSTIESRGN